MTPAELNHLRRLLAWVQCEIGQAPEEYVETARRVAEKLGNPELDAAAQQRLVQHYDKARATPRYVREAVKALRKVVGTGAIVEEARPVVRRLGGGTENDR